MDIFYYFVKIFFLVLRLGIFALVVYFCFKIFKIELKFLKYFEEWFDEHCKKK